MEPRERRVRANGIELAYFEWAPERRGRGPTFLLVHATGFHARCWDPVVRRLGEAHVIALDMRSHGRSEKREITHWNVFGCDLGAFLEALDLREVIGVGHSMGGHALVDATAAHPERLLRLLLVDPVIAAPDQYGGGGWTIEIPGGGPHPTARRKRHFATAQEMIERFRDRPPFGLFHPEALHAYCTWGLLPAEDGDGLDLACPPEIEASIYLTSRTHEGVYASVRALEQPVLLLRARLPPADRDLMDFSSSPTWPGLVGELPRGREIFFAHHSHFLPMEIPEAVAGLILAEARLQGAFR